MTCKFCNMEVAEGAVFCPHCGQRLDGRIACPECGAMNDEGAVFCASCGKRLDGKQVCHVCHTLYEGRFCPECGASNEPVAAPAPTADPEPRTVQEAPEAEEPQKPATWKKILLIVAGALGMAAAGLSLIFTLLIGFDGPSEEMSALLPGLGAGKNIFYYFYQGFKDTSDTISSMAVMGSVPFMTYLTSYLRVGLGTMIAGATIITVLVLAIKTTIHYIAYATGKSGKGIGKLACGTYFAFVAGVVGLYALEHFTTKSSSGTLGANVALGISLNGATVAGLVLGAICVFCYLALSAAPRAKELLKKRTLSELICSTVGLVLLAVILALAAGAGVGYSMSGSGMSQSLNISFAQIFYTIGFTSMMGSSAQGTLWIDFLLNLTSFVLLGIVVIMSAKELVSRTRSFEKDTTLLLGRSIGIFILAAIFAAVGIFTVRRSAVYMDVDLNAEGVTAGYAPMIAIGVLAALNLARAITQNVLQKTMK